MASSSASLKEYLKKYQSGADDKANKKKKKRKEKPNPVGVLVVDGDPVWQKPIENELEEEESGEDLPLVEEDIEVKRLKRLQALRAQKPYHKISEDGSGWVSISDQPKTLNAAADGNYDLSPPRQRPPRVDTPSPHRGADDSGNGDLSPPRRRRQLDTPSSEKEARAPALGEVDDDLSPPQRNSNRSPDADLSPPRRNRKGSVDDLSPSRRNRNRDMSPPRRSISQMPKDISPPLRNRNHVATSPPRRMTDRSTESDLSPPRKTRRGHADEVSLTERSRHRALNESREGSDLSPRRLREEAVLTKKEDLPSPRRRVEPLVKEVRKTGLLTAKEIKEDNEKRRKEEISRFAAMDPSISGKGAQPVFRDRKGNRINREELLEAQEKEEEEEKKSKEKKLEWGKGLAQKREAEARAQELEFEKDKPFARSRDDPELDKMLKERVRWGDPMAHLVKGNTELILEDLGRDEKMKESGFIIPQTIPSHSWIKRGIDFPANRYGIRPGRHWDGVDRSNGYEKELFKRQNEKRATEAEAYLWSVSDM